MPAYERLPVDERRRRLLELGTRLLTEHTYAELSMAAIAREAGISKALLHHYFPSKQAFFTATLQAAAGELQAAVRLDDERSPAEQLSAGVEAYVAWIAQNRTAYAKLLHSVQVAGEVRDVVAGVRAETARRMLEGLAPGGAPPALRTAVHGWLWFMDGALLDWVENDDIARPQLQGLLLGTLLGAVTAAGEGHRLAPLLGAGSR